ncbi:ubiquinone biosynthesis protein COQ9-B, mitochondrial [Telopea speciosissima]|uniref:ubiquinone biosynthesis protein COQ9-B, mitochondrial n=1 Tax=Telopea speciosissima TaxID=54955 RepID=UPI001CC5D211|nr:ubiquinone biosynthesis protein COQ9-B, mitochondrial [Telopea speciosissima]XP_043689556.1 ubiquinone biosynthesis protein COQ9-B, mitochondrial [Telopea speciosissima]XP_043689557.1 ubiquinone biosynthesis protein COQ9-B, mitochondrial [Telopea speciosissima]XP_043689558.1 ubiquinone biosynthesis protein COQ9-B, mitochondrial [Telopea speciosissima]
MYRSVVKRFLVIPAHRRFAVSPITTKSSCFSTDSNAQPLRHTDPIHSPKQTETVNSASATTAAAGFSNEEAHSASATTGAAASINEQSQERQSSRGVRQPRIEYQEEQARVLQAALRHVVSLGWTEAAMITGAREVGVSPAIVGSFPRKEAVLVEFFMDECLQRLIDIIDSGEELRNLIPSECVSKLIWIRLEMQAPHISKWPQALSIQAQPMNIPTSFKQRAMLVDEILHATGDQASDIDWYLKRTVIGGIYSTSEVYMLTDNSPDFQDTWHFMDGRVKDAFDIGKAIQEAKYLAETVGAGMGNPLQDIMKRVLQR